MNEETIEVGCVVMLRSDNERKMDVDTINGNKCTCIWPNPDNIDEINSEVFDMNDLVRTDFDAGEFLDEVFGTD